MPIANLFGALPENLPEEQFDVLLSQDGLKLERIVSTGQTTPPGEWYDQDGDEWVTLLTGGARLRLTAPDEELTLRPGDHLLIPAHRRHRVEWTSPAEPTVWLALHLPADR